MRCVSVAGGGARKVFTEKNRRRRLARRRLRNRELRESAEHGSARGRGDHRRVRGVRVGERRRRACGRFSEREIQIRNPTTKLAVPANANQSRIQGIGRGGSSNEREGRGIEGGGVAAQRIRSRRRRGAGRTKPGAPGREIARRRLRLRCVPRNLRGGDFHGRSGASGAGRRKGREEFPGEDRGYGSVRERRRASSRGAKRTRRRRGSPARNDRV
mmetsp:Transcript_2296/g.7981  ORF Transcript_2296/g.7981 Transcript_2296/m.7981 type:complete len:215 (+) Transcript_2296:3157-3801(+)